MRLRSLAFPALLLLILLGMSWIVMTNYRRVDELRQQGKDPITVATPGVAGRDGLPGPRGEKGEPGEPGPRGHAGRDGEDGADGQTGDPGADGVDGVDGRDGQSIQGTPGTPGPQGQAGPQGLPGAPGVNGRSMMLACVLVHENMTDVRYYSAKYTDEPDSALLTWPYRSRLPSWFVPADCIDMRNV